MLVDDLITRGTVEPYRMFTSRAEYRLLLREDNADLRLTPIGRELGLVDDERWRVFSLKREAVERETGRLAGIRVGSADLEEQVPEPADTRGTREYRALDLLKRPEMRYPRLTALAAVGQRVRHPDETEELAEQIEAQVEVQARYEGYVRRQEQEIARNRRNAETLLPPDLDYASVRGLSSEIRQKLSASRPATVAQASRISGITPAAISNLLVHIKKRRLREA